MEKEPAVFGLFWDSLVASGTLDAGLISELKESWSPNSWKPLGEVMIRKRLLTLSQVAGLIGIQADEPHMRIGDLAIREGLCKPESLEDALAEQRRACPGPIEILMRDGDVGSDELLDILLTYVRFLEGRILGEQKRQEALTSELSHPGE